MGISTEPVTQAVARRYVDTWTHGDLDGVRALFADDVAVECNLGWPADPTLFIDTLGRLAAAVGDSRLLSDSYTGDRAVLAYDLEMPAGSIALLEFLEIADGRIREVRRVYDAAAMRRLLPGLVA